MSTHTYKNLIVWQRSTTLTLEIYRTTKGFPKEELYGLTSQMRRAAISIPSNIAEGRLRDSSKEFRKFLLIAFASGGELETQIEIAKQLKLVTEKDFETVESLLSEVMKMLNVMISNLTPNT